MKLPVMEYNAFEDVECKAAFLEENEALVMEWLLSHPSLTEEFINLHIKRFSEFAYKYAVHLQEDKESESGH